MGMDRLHRRRHHVYGAMLCGCYHGCAYHHHAHTYQYVLLNALLRQATNKWAVWKLNISKQKKKGLSIVFLMGILTVIASAMRLVIQYYAGEQCKCNI